SGSDRWGVARDVRIAGDLRPESDVLGGERNAIVPENVWLQPPGQLHGAVVGHLPGAVGEGGHLLSDVGLEDLVVVVDGEPGVEDESILGAAAAYTRTRSGDVDDAGRGASAHGFFLQLHPDRD